MQACLPVVFECMWCRTIQCAEPVLLRVINEDIFNVSDTDDIPMLKKRLVNLQNYFRYVQQACNFIKKIIDICVLHRPEEMY